MSVDLGSCWTAFQCKFAFVSIRMIVNRSLPFCVLFIVSRVFGVSEKFGVL
jgi:hypothetical protein